MNTPSAWNPLWPTRYEVTTLLSNSRLHYAPPVPLGEYGERFALEVPTLSQHPAWALWIWNPDLDYIVPPNKVDRQHWVNAVISPLHGACVRAARQTLPAAFWHRLRCGEVAQSQRPRYLGEAPLRVRWMQSDTFW